MIITVKVLDNSYIYMHTYYIHSVVTLCPSAPTVRCVAAFVCDHVNFIAKLQNNTAILSSFCIVFPTFHWMNEARYKTLYYSNKCWSNSLFLSYIIII